MGHASHKVPGVEDSTGSLGHGLPFGCGKSRKIQAKTWQSFKFFTEARYWYQQYMLTDNEEHLKCSKENCLMGLNYEKNYEDIHSLLLNLAAAYERH